jgi:spore coat polysaccharide biosynthesis protein SpsF
MKKHGNGKKIMIGVQARSNSTRLRGKCAMQIDQGKNTMAGHVLSRAERAAQWLKDICDPIVVMLVPYDDPIGNTFRSRAEVYYGDEQDVLARYYAAVQHYDASHMVRLTADCAFMTATMITKIIRDGLKYGADYCSNVLVRTFMEGLDVEYISARLLKVLYNRVDTNYGREHVTAELPAMLDKGQLAGFVIHTVLSEYDLSHIKTSIDTKDEYDKSMRIYAAQRLKTEQAQRYGSVSK